MKEDESQYIFLIIQYLRFGVSEKRSVTRKIQRLPVAKKPISALCFFFDHDFFDNITLADLINHI